MIISFGDKIAECLFLDLDNRLTKKIAPDIRRAARRKLQYIHEATNLQDLRVPPGNRLEALKGDLKGFYSIRVNNPWRFIFKWKNNNAEDVQLVDYH